MTLDPQCAEVVAAISSRFPDLGRGVTDATEARRILASNPAPELPRLPLHSVFDDSVPGPAGPIPTRVYRPTPRESEPSAAIVFFHGGGWTICSIETHDALCRQLADATGAVVISVDFRMAPEHRFPAAADDAEAAVRWVAGHPDDFGIDPRRIGVAGDSAGGNLAAVVAQRFLRTDGPQLAFQLLIYPMLDRRFDTTSYVANAHGYAVTIDHMRWYWEQYLGPQDGTSPDASPLRAERLDGLPPTYIVAAEHCPLRSENEAYAEALSAAGVRVTYDCRPGTFHGFFHLGHRLDAARAASADAYAAVREALTIGHG